MIPVLMITYNRLEFTKKALEAILNSDCGTVHIYDNNSSDGTQDYLRNFIGTNYARVVLSKANVGIAGAMNYFLSVTDHCEFIAKVDNDTLIPPDFIARMLLHLKKADLVQAKHCLIAASGVGSFDEWVSKMPGDDKTRFNHFIGGSGIVCRRSVLSYLTPTHDKLMSWRGWQREHPEVKKAFALDCEIKLLDTNEEGADYSQFPEYYKETGRC